jgi:hypothetical protein
MPGLQSIMFKHHLTWMASVLECDPPSIIEALYKHRPAEILCGQCLKTGFPPSSICSASPNPKYGTHDRYYLLKRGSREFAGFTIPKEVSSENVFWVQFRYRGIDKRSGNPWTDGYLVSTVNMIANFAHHLKHNNKGTVPGTRLRPPRHQWNRSSFDDDDFRILHREGVLASRERGNIRRSFGLTKMRKAKWLRKTSRMIGTTSEQTREERRQKRKRRQSEEDVY